MAHLKNYRGATNYFTPSSDKYRDNYDRIFRSKKPDVEECPHTHVWENKAADEDAPKRCVKCGEAVG